MGDDDQSIYSWRGAVPANIIDFDKVYSDAKTIALELNYRCTNNIVTAAREVIKNNRYRAEKSLQTEAPDGDLIDLQVEPDGDAEAWAIADSINAEINQYNLDDIAIFYRTNSQTRILEDALRRNNLPYRIYGSLEFYDRVEIKDLMAFLKYINNKKDALSLKRIINTPTKGLGPKTWDMLDEMIETSTAIVKRQFRVWLS